MISSKTQRFRGEIRVNRLERKKKGRAGERAERGREGGLTGLGFGLLLGPGLGRLGPECRIAESAQFCDSTIQRAIQPRLHHPDSPHRIGIGDLFLNRKIVRFYDSNHDSDNHVY
ncbi:hypothetical protein CDL15_Pgr004631 [Punica granatum]|uniref:Uncharacterized protein n=1 Tax=Punica granatum TaxID=22663 RepID=A0A218WPU6_PUNGR|nr:hypothetical protein CDL15_Pgr004631 [Punica granatum]